MNMRSTQEQEKHIIVAFRGILYSVQCTCTMYTSIQRQSFLKIHDFEIVVKFTCTINVLYYLYCTVLYVLFCQYSIHFSICAGI